MFIMTIVMFVITSDKVVISLVTFVMTSGKVVISLVMLRAFNPATTMKCGQQQKIYVNCGYRGTRTFGFPHKQQKYADGTGARKSATAYISVRYGQW
jgi:hypothetical protein